MKRVRRSPVLGAVAAWLAAVVPACRHAEVSARLGEGRERFRKLLIRREKKPHNSLVRVQFAADLIV